MTLEHDAGHTIFAYWYTVHSALVSDGVESSGVDAPIRLDLRGGRRQFVGALLALDGETGRRGWTTPARCALHTQWHGRDLALPNAASRAVALPESTARAVPGYPPGHRPSNECARRAKCQGA